MSSTSTTDHIHRLDKLTVLSRILVAASIHISSSYLPLFDASPSTFLTPPASRSFASPLLRWDAFHFVAIAKEGYSHDQHWAFFPGVPLLLRIAHRLPVLFVDHTTSALAWVALLHASIAIPTTRAIYHLTLIHFRSPSFALLTALLSLLPASPATLYFAPYAEPIFTFLSYRGMLACARKHYFSASLYLAAAAAFRSNGILLALYVPWSLLIDPLLLSFTLPSPSMVLRACFHALLPLLPSLFHQINAYRAFCIPNPTPDAQRPPWCNNVIPSIYAHVQRTYWHVGFLSYWTPAQLPNIVLALPLIVPLLFHSVSHASLRIRGKSGILRPSTTTVHAVHATILCITLLTNAHTQIALRLLPALPSTYWSVAALLVERPWWGRAYVVWAVLWCAASVVLWATFLPPA
ncbi:glycosyltransferase family 76 protein [Russula earlei]|uniref:Glycosyltransferase family 76 protein n=1 Tax=Russula earlei TaxID=71964 RepID=A0ACC0TSZ4_9AGAM|nr:glycosyltransferase family 76 protein [Russula earlei]